MGLFSCRKEVWRIGNLIEEMKKYDDVDEQTLWWINQALSYSDYPSKERKERLKEHMKEIETMENNKVRQFVDLLLNGETVKNATTKEAIQTVKDLDNALVDLKKSSEK